VLEVALRCAMCLEGLAVVDVRVDGTVPPPFAGRNRSIRSQEEIKESGQWTKPG